MSEGNTKHYGEVLAAASLVVSAAIAYAIEAGLVSWSWWWLGLTATPFVWVVLAPMVGLVGIGVVYAIAKLLPTRRIGWPPQ